jgi:hypothetical protein
MANFKFSSIPCCLSCTIQLHEPSKILSNLLFSSTQARVVLVKFNLTSTLSVHATIHVQYLRDKIISNNHKYYHKEIKS